MVDRVNAKTAYSMPTTSQTRKKKADAKNIINLSIQQVNERGCHL
jgi:hypothetical protein